MSANSKQHGGNHYKDKGIEPWDYIIANDIGFLDGTAIKYLSRWKQKGGIEDLKKAIHFIEKLIEVEEAETVNLTCTKIVAEVIEPLDLRTRAEKARDL